MSIETTYGSLSQDKEILLAEHDGTSNVAVKKTGLYAWDTPNMQWVRVGATSEGVLLAGDTFSIPEYDKIELGYSGARVSTVTYKLGGTTIATLTLNYTGTTLDSVVKT